MLMSVSALVTSCIAVVSFQAPKIRDSSGVRVVENAAPMLANAWRVPAQPLAQIGVTAGDPAQELYRVAGVVLLTTDVVVVANGGTNELRWYSPEGRHIRTVGGSGGGPGEFSMLSEVFGLPGDSVAAYDVRARRLTVFDSAGQFVRSQQVPPDPTFLYPSLTHRFGDGTYLAVTGSISLGDHGPTRVERLPFGVYRFVPASGRIEEIASYPGLEVIIGPTGGMTQDGTVLVGRNRRAFGRNTTVTGYADGWIVADNDRPELQYWSATAGLRIIARWHVEPQPTTRADIETYKKALFERSDDPAWRRRMEAAWAAWPDPPNTKPYFGDQMQVDPAGNVWIQEFIGPEGGGNTWSVLDASGRWLVDVVLPSHHRVLAVGDDRIVLLQRTELDVEVLSVHEIQKR
jgi:hypothetical protein